MRITFDQLKCMLADQYNVSRHNVQFNFELYADSYIEIEGLLEDGDGLERPGVIKTGREISDEILEANKTVKELGHALDLLNDEEFDENPAFPIVKKAYNEKDEEYRNLLKREYKY